MGKAEAVPLESRIKSTCSRVTGLIDLGMEAIQVVSRRLRCNKTCWPEASTIGVKDRTAAWAIPHRGEAIGWLEVRLMGNGEAWAGQTLHLARRKTGRGFGVIRPAAHSRFNSDPPSSTAVLPGVKILLSRQ